MKSSTYKWNCSVRCLDKWRRLSTASTWDTARRSSHSYDLDSLRYTDRSNWRRSVHYCIAENKCHASHRWLCWWARLSGTGQCWSGIDLRWSRPHTYKRTHPAGRCTRHRLDTAVTRTRSRLLHSSRLGSPSYRYSCIVTGSSRTLRADLLCTAERHSNQSDNHIKYQKNLKRRTRSGDKQHWKSLFSNHLIFFNTNLVDKHIWTYSCCTRWDTWVFERLYRASWHRSPLYSDSRYLYSLVDTSNWSYRLSCDKCRCSGTAKVTANTHWCLHYMFLRFASLGYTLKYVNLEFS